jgi:hypothetical protein
MAARLEGGRDTGKPQSFGLDPLRDPLRCECQAVTLTRAPQSFQKPFKTYLDSVHDCGAASDAENLAVLSQQVSMCACSAPRPILALFAASKPSRCAQDLPTVATSRPSHLDMLVDSGVARGELAFVGFGESSKI